MDIRTQLLRDDSFGMSVIFKTHLLKELNILYLMNQHAEVVIQTSSGNTTRTSMTNLIMQGTVWGRLFCTVSMDKLPMHQYENTEMLYNYRCVVCVSDQSIVIFPANRNRNIFAQPTSVRIGIGMVHEFQNLEIGIGTIFVRWEVFANYSQIPEISFFSPFFLKVSFS